MSAVNDSSQASEDLAVANQPPADVVIGPMMTDGSAGLYPRELGELAEELRQQQVTVAFQHSGDDRQWIDPRGPAADMVLEAVIGLASGAALEALKYVLAKLRTPTGRSRQVSIEVRTADGRALELHGTAQDIAETLARLDDVEGGPENGKANS